MEYKVLLTDQDDTATNTTKTIHHPVHHMYVNEYCSGRTPLTYSAWIENLFTRGFHGLYKELFGLTDEDIQHQIEFWKRESVKLKDDFEFFPGFVESAKQFQDNGGLVAVVSYSNKELINHHYSLKGKGLKPNYVIDFETLPEDQMKPNPGCVSYLQNSIKSDFGIDVGLDEILVVGDSTADLELAKNAGIDFAAACWAHDVKLIHDAMKKEADYYLTHAGQLENILTKK